jgi:hypothetical protein
MIIRRLWTLPQGATPAGSEDERRYFRHAASRLGAFSNITWDLGDDLDSFRDESGLHRWNSSGELRSV